MTENSKTFVLMSPALWLFAVTKRIHTSTLKNGFNNNNKKHNAEHQASWNDIHNIKLYQDPVKRSSFHLKARGVPL